VLADVGYQIASSHISDSFQCIQYIASDFIKWRIISLLHYREILSLVAVFLCVLRKVMDSKVRMIKINSCMQNDRNAIIISIQSQRVLPWNHHLIRLHLFEVLYVGKLRMSYRKTPTSFIDEALDKFKSHENEKMMVERRDSVLESRRSSSQSQVLIKVHLCILNNKIRSYASFPIQSMF
jgi:hypothetical protein